MPLLTDEYLAGAQCPGTGQVFYRDSELRGFALRASRHTKSFVVELRVNGANKRITIGKFGEWTTDAARAQARCIIAAHCAVGPLAPNKAITVRAILNEYIRVRKLRPNTVRGYNGILRRCIGDWLDMPIQSITRAMVRERHRELAKTTKMNTSGEVQANMAMHMLSALINYAAANYENADGSPLIARNPVSVISQSRAWYQESRRSKFIPDNKLAEWYSVVSSLRKQALSDFLVFVLLTGLRRNEASTLTWDDVDFEKQTVRVRAEVSKNRREHLLPMSTFVYHLLLRRRRTYPKIQYVFPGRSINDHIVDSDHVISGVGKKIKHEFTVHDLRRTFLTMAERLDVPYLCLKRLANHAYRGDVTAGYVIVDVERLRPYMEKISEEFLRLFDVPPPYAVSSWIPETTEITVPERAVQLRLL